MLSKFGPFRRPSLFISVNFIVSYLPQILKTAIKFLTIIYLTMKLDQLLMIIVIAGLSVYFAVNYLVTRFSKENYKILREKGSQKVVLEYQGLNLLRGPEGPKSLVASHLRL